MKPNKKGQKDNSRYFNYFISGLFLFLLPTQLGKHFFLNFSYVNGVRVDYLSLILYTTDIVFFILFFLNIGLVLNEIKKRAKLILLFLLFFFINILISQYPPLSFYHLLKILEIYFIFIIFKNFKNAKLILISFLLGGLFQLIPALTQLYQKSSLQGIFYFFGERYLSLSQPGVAKASIKGIEFLRPYGTFSHPNSLAGFYLFLYFFFLIDKKFNRFVFLKNLSLLIFSLLIFISFSKATIVAYLVLNVFYVVRYFKVKPRTDLQSGAGVSCRVCLLAKIVSIFIVAFIFLQTKTDPLSLEKRVSLFKNGLAIFLNHPFFGVGLGHYLIYQAKIPMKYPYFFLQPVHNIFVLFLAEAGIVLGGIVFYWLFRFFKKNVETQNFASLLICLLVVLITGSFDHYWLTLQQNWLLMGVIFGNLSSERKPVSNP